MEIFGGKYMSSKYVDTPSIIQVIGCVCKVPQLLDYSDKYTLTEEETPFI